MAPLESAWERLGPTILFSNASCAFCLNIAVVFLIGCASSLVLTLSGVIKDILLVGGSVLILGSTVTFVQIVGYGIALRKCPKSVIYTITTLKYQFQMVMS